MSQSVWGSDYSSSAQESSTSSECSDEPSDGPGASYRSMPLRMTGVEIVELRQRVGWSQADLAAQIAYSQRQVSRWERGQQLVSQEACVAILRAVTDARLSAEEQRLARYQLQRWLRGVQDATCGAMSRLGLG